MSQLRDIWKIEGRVVGVAQVDIFGTDWPLMLLCPKDKVLSKNEIEAIMTNIRRTIYDIYFDEKIDE